MRVPSITRTVKGMEVTVMAVDVESAEVMNKTFILPRVYLKDNLILKAVEKTNTDPNTKIVALVDKKTVEAKYTMTLEKFIENATIAE